VKELDEKKKLEILRLYLQGCSYDQVSTGAAVGKGTVVNVLNDFRTGRFPAFTDVAEQ
jgi:transposase